MVENKDRDQVARLSPTQARSGFISGRVITVLIASVILAVVLVGGVTVFWTSSH
jgi:nitrate reductase NapE component